MKNTLISACAALLLASAANARTVERPIPVAGQFNAISVSDNIAVSYTCAPQTKVTVKASDKDIDNIVVKLADNKLRLYMKGRINHAQAKVYVSAPAVYTFSAEDNTSIDIRSELKGATIKIDAEDNSRITAPAVTATTASVEASDNASVSVRTMTAKAALAVEADDNASVDIAGITTGRLLAEASDNSSVEVAGKATEVTYRASDNSSIKAGRLAANRGQGHASDTASITSNVQSMTVHSSDSGSVSNQPR